MRIGKPTLLLLMVLVALFASRFAVAEQPGSEAGVPLYTNADLLKFGPPSTIEPDRGSDAVEKADAMAWEATCEFIEREYRRIETERKLRLELVRRSGEQKASTTRLRFTRSHHSLWDSGATFTNAVSAAAKAKSPGIRRP